MNRINSIKICIEHDEAPDLSYLGEYTDVPTESTIVRSNRFFEPPENGEKVGSKEWKKYAAQSFNRAKRFYNGSLIMVGVYAAVFIDTENGDTQKITTNGLWNIESDSDRSYFVEVAQEETEELKSTLIALNVDLSDFDTFFNDAIEKMEL